MTEHTAKLLAELKRSAFRFEEILSVTEEEDVPDRERLGQIQAWATRDLPRLAGVIAAAESRS